MKLSQQTRTDRRGHVHHQGMACFRDSSTLEARESFVDNITRVSPRCKNRAEYQAILYASQKSLFVVSPILIIFPPHCFAHLKNLPPSQSRMMATGTLLITFVNTPKFPNFWRMVFNDPAVTTADIDFILRRVLGQNTGRIITSLLLLYRVDLGTACFSFVTPYLATAI